MSGQITLLIPEKADLEYEQVVTTWTKRGGQLRRLGKYWIRDESLSGQPIAIYGNQTFSLVLAQIYQVELISPDDTLIAMLDVKWTKRNIVQKAIGQLTHGDFPVFIKPVIPKLFLAGVFQTHSDFEAATNGLQKEEELLISDIVDPILAEARGFVMQGMIRDLALYEGAADLAAANTFLADFIKNNFQLLPKVVVVDIAFNEQTGWFVLEFNACWGAGLNNCRAEKVVDCIIGATVLPSQ